jgi:hypothetical protein
MSKKIVLATFTSLAALSGAAFAAPSTTNTAAPITIAHHAKTEVAAPNAQSPAHHRRQHHQQTGAKHESSGSMNSASPATRPAP